MATPRHVFSSEICGGDPQPHVAYPHDRQMQELVTAGIKRNRKVTFKIEFPGARFYDLLQVLDKIALQTDSVIEMRECVHLSDEIAAQLRAQGFYGEAEAQEE